MKQINITDFRAHIGQYLDDLTTPSTQDENGEKVFELTPTHADSLLQIGDIRNDNRILLCKQDTFRHYAQQYHSLQQHYNCLEAMSLKTIGTLLHAPALANVPLTILHSLCTLFETAQNVLAVALQQYPYPIFQNLDMLPLLNGQATKAPLSLFILHRFLENTYRVSYQHEGPIHLDIILDSLLENGILPFTFNQDVTKCSIEDQAILKEAIEAVHPILNSVTTYETESVPTTRLDEWYATYISPDIPMYHNGHIWTYNYNTTKKKP